MWVLALNDMRFSNSERTMPVAKAETAIALAHLIQREAVPVYVDGPWRKTFRKGGPLEWYNCPFGPGDLIGKEHPCYNDIGTEADWANTACMQYHVLVTGLLQV